MHIKSVIKRVISKLIKYGYQLLYLLVPVNKKTVLFIAYHGRGYLCNPKAIHQYMVNSKEYQDYTFVWAIKKNKKVNIPNAKVVRYYSIPYFYYLARSKYWVFNCKMPAYLKKKKSQIYLQTWHGTPLKRLAHDINTKDDATFYRTKMSREQMVKTYDSDSVKYDYFLSPNEFSTQKFMSAFRIDREKIIEIGYPRNDYISNIKQKEIEYLKFKYKIPLDKKVILYAPTWRDNSFVSKGYVHELKVDFNKWKKELGNEYVVIFKPHYLIINKFENDDLNGFLYSISEDAEINELYVISDLLITDYSSVFFDYAILNRPILFYMYDLEEYEHQIRGFYLNIHEDLPGEIITDELMLINKIKSINDNIGEDSFKLNKFNETYNQLHKGICAKLVVEQVIK